MSMIQNEEFQDTWPTAPAPLEQRHRPDPRDKWAHRLAVAIVLVSACALLVIIAKG